MDVIMKYLSHHLEGIVFTGTCSDISDVRECICECTTIVA